MSVLTRAKPVDSVGFVDAVLKPGKFPDLPTTVATLPTVQHAAIAAAKAVEFRDITCFYGDTGTGKTTAVTYATTHADGVEWRYCVPPQKTNTKGMMLAVYEAVFRVASPKTERDAENAVMHRMAEGDLGLVVDEVHHIGAVGMQKLRNIADQAATYGHPFPMIFVGCDVPSVLAAAREVRGRVARWVPFGYLHDDEDLLDYVTALHPRLAATPINTLRDINERIVDRELRGWHHFAKEIINQPGKPKALTATEIRHIRIGLGRP